MVVQNHSALTVPPSQQYTASPAFPHALPFFLPYIVPILTVIVNYSPNPIHALLPPLFVWVIIPLFDFLISPHPANRPPLTRLQRRVLESKPVFKFAILLWCPTQLSTLIWAAFRTQQVTQPVQGLRLLGLLLSVGLIAAEGINCSHELLHRRSKFERTLGQLLLVSVSYGHFAIEHSRGHHKNVATPHDPATMHLGESFYRFLPRTVIGGYMSAWRLEVERLGREGQLVWGWHNDMLRFGVGQLAFCVAFFMGLGSRALAMFLFQSAFAIVLLEQINAIEHYGLQRRKLGCGKYEPVGPRHSWDAPQLVSNYLLFKLQLHADHHLHVSRRYQTLQLTQGSPQLPMGYLSLAPLLFIPPLWRAVMDPVLFKYWEKWDEDNF